MDTSTPWIQSKIRKSVVANSHVSFPEGEKW